MAMVFQPGFSTAAKVTNVSGRGVGMDVVKTNIENIGGAVSVDSTPGEGTVWRLTIPLTLAIIQALTVDCGDQRYVVPQVAVLELVFIDGTVHQDRVRLRRARLPPARQAAPAGPAGPRARPRRRRRPGRLHHGAAGRRPAVRPGRRPGAEHRRGRGQGAQQPVQGHRAVRRRDHPRRRQGRPDPGRLRRWPGAATWPPTPSGRTWPARRGPPAPAAPASGCWSPRSASAGWRSRWTRSPGSRSSRATGSSTPAPARSSSTAGQILPAGAAVAPARGVRRGAGGRHRVGGRLQRGRAQRGPGGRPDRRHRRELAPPPAATPRRTAWSAPRSSSSG